MVEIECLACGKAIKPQQLNDTDNYDTENYDGQIVCQECQSLLYIKLVKSKVQKYRVKQRGFREPSGEQLSPGLVVELFKILTQKQKELRDEEGKHEEK